MKYHRRQFLIASGALMLMAGCADPRSDDAVLGPSTVAGISEYSVVYIDGPADWVTSTALGISGSHVVGYASTDQFEKIAFRSHGGPAIPLPSLPGVSGPGNGAMAVDVNIRGVVVGETILNNQTDRAVYWTPGGAIGIVPVPDPTQTSSAFAINASGTIVGRNGTHAFRYSPETGPVDLHAPEMQSSVANDVNDDGTVAGTAVLLGSALSRAVVWYLDGSYEYLPTPQGATADHEEGDGINAQGWVVGAALFEDERPVVWRPDPVVIPIYGRAHAINSSGRVVGYSKETGEDGFTVLDGDPVFLSPPGYGSDAYDVNECGNIAGQVHVSVGGAVQAVVWTHQLCDLGNQSLQTP